jgi:predicted GNAT family acetyltransferase
MPAPIRDNTALSRFELEADGHVAFANYTTEPGVITLTHTEVPRALREGGVGTKLVLGTLALIRERGERVRPRCSFVRHVIAQHPELADLVV